MPESGKGLVREVFIHTWGLVRNTGDTLAVSLAPVLPFGCINFRDTKPALLKKYAALGGSRLS